MNKDIANYYWRWFCNKFLNIFNAEERFDDWVFHLKNVVLVRHVVNRNTLFPSKSRVTLTSMHLNFKMDGSDDVWLETFCARFDFVTNEPDSIDLSYNRISCVRPLGRFKNLKYIDLRKNPLKEGEIEWLRAKFPDAEILHD